MSTSVPPLANGNYLSIHTEQLFAEEECDRIVEMCDGKWGPAGVTAYDSSGGGAVRPGVRSALAQRLSVDDTGWPFSPLLAAIGSANDQKYRFDLSGFELFDPPTVLRYESNVADHFRPHRDAGDHFPTRKLSCVVQLSHPDEYRGGSLLFMEEDAIAPTSKGSLIVFPSFLIHQVTPIVAGVRNVIVAWVHGPTFR